MSVASQITRLQTAKSNLRTAINSKLTSNPLSTSASISDYSAAVSRITTAQAMTDPDDLIKAYSEAIGGAQFSSLGSQLCWTNMNDGQFDVDIIDRSTFTLRISLRSSTVIKTLLGVEIPISNSDTGSSSTFSFNMLTADYMGDSSSAGRETALVHSTSWPLSVASFVGLTEFDWCIDPSATCAGLLYYNSNNVRCYYLGDEV